MDEVRTALAAIISPEDAAGRTRLDLLRVAAGEALTAGEVGRARQIIDEAVAADAVGTLTGDWSQLRDITAWPDAWLVAAIRRDPPDEPALDVLAERHWRPLFARCQMLTLNREQAADLAQEAWCRILRNRPALRPEGNFPAYLATVATNLWRDQHRAARRAGPMAAGRLLSLEAPLAADEAGSCALGDLLPDLNTLDGAQQMQLKLDIDQALARLGPLLHEVVVARFLLGESCAEIGRRHGRTEQTVSAWVREGVRQMQGLLAELRGGAGRPGEKTL